MRCVVVNIFQCISQSRSYISVILFFFNDTATTEIYTLSLHDALPIYESTPSSLSAGSDATPMLNAFVHPYGLFNDTQVALDRKSTRLNSSHANISYAVFCLKKKKIIKKIHKPLIHVILHMI